MAELKSRSTPWVYLREFGSAMVLYTAVVMTTASARGHVQPDALAVAVELTPVIPLALAFWAIVRQYARFDELKKRIQSEAFALGAMFTGLGMTVYGFLENAGAPPLPTIWVAPIMIGLWGLSLPVVRWRYR